MEKYMRLGLNSWVCSWVAAAALIGLGCSADDKPGDRGLVSSRAGSGGTDEAGAGEGSGEAGGGSDEPIGGDSGEPVGGESGSIAGAGAGNGPSGIIEDWVVPEELQLCSEGACACADGIDNDDDGVADGFDLECQGPNDNDEGSFATGISGDNQDPKWMDCFFDGNSGAGDDDCRYHVECLTGERAADDPDCVVSEECIAFCAQRSPNGCDCFGCCTLQREDGSQIHVAINETCDENDLDSCATCRPSTQCGNECGECELCPGKTVADLPDSCYQSSGEGGAGGGGSEEDPPPVSCDDGGTVCSSSADCEVGSYCVYACCTIALPG
jgi:hypothetical protein